MLEYAIDKEICLLFIQETWLTDSNNHTTASIKAHGFKVYHYHRPFVKGGGVAIIYREDLKIVRYFHSTFKSFEAVSAKLILPNGKALLLSSVYRTGAMGSFMDDFENFLGDVFVKFEHFLICGDINLHLEKLSTHSTDFINVLSSYGLYQWVKGATHKAGHTLDVIISSHKIVSGGDVKIDKDSTEKFTSCDHFPLLFRLEPKGSTVDCKKLIKFRSIHKVDSHSFTADIKEALALTPSTVDFSQVVENYNLACSSVMDKHAPLLEKSIRELGSAKWFDSEYKSARIERRRAEKKWRKSGTESDRAIFNERRTHCEELAKSKKKMYFKGHFLKYNNSQKALFKFVDVFLDNDSSITLPPTENIQQTVEQFNSFFTEKIERIRENFPDATSPTLTNLFQGTKLYDFTPTSEEELRDILKSVDIKSCDLDPIPACLMKENLDTFLPILKDIVNLSISSGNMDGLKSANLTPLLKGKSLDSTAFKNYRPVSNLAFVGKVIEKVVQSRLEEHMKRNNLVTPMQSAYKKHHSTETLLVRIVNDLLIASDEKKSTVVLLLDLSAAFDTVDHQKLLSILYNEIGICGMNVLKWFKSYLTGRCQKVKIAGCESIEIIIRFGVPQGSVLGPILFNIYIRSLYRTVQTHKFNIHGFADDHQVYKAFDYDNEYQIMVDEVPKCFDIITRWMMQHFLQLNPGKTEIIVFGTPSCLSKLRINGIFIAPDICVRLVSTVKNLGFHLDSSLDFTYQVRKLKSSCFHKLRNIGKMKPFLDTKQMQQLVQAVVLSSLDYCNALYYGCNTSVIKQLQIIQNRACATIFGLKKSDRKSDNLKKLHWLKIQERIEFKLLLLTFKALNGSAPTYLQELVRYNHMSGSRSPSLKTQINRTSLGDRAFVSSAAKLWNNLPENIKNSPSVTYFKKSLKTYLFRKSYGGDI